LNGKIGMFWDLSENREWRCRTSDVWWNVVADQMESWRACCDRPTR